MKLAGWKRAMLAGLMTLSVAGGSLAPVVAGQANAGGGVRVGSSGCPCGPEHNQP